MNGKITDEIQSIFADALFNEVTNTKFYIAKANLSLQNKDSNVCELKTGMMLKAKTINGSKKYCLVITEDRFDWLTQPYSIQTITSVDNDSIKYHQTWKWL